MNHVDILRLAALVTLNPNDSKASLELARAVQAQHGLVVSPDINPIIDAALSGDTEDTRKACESLGVGLVVSDLAVRLANATKYTTDKQLERILQTWGVQLSDFIETEQLQAILRGVDFDQFKCLRVEGEYSYSEAQFLGHALCVVEESADYWFYGEEESENTIQAEMVNCMWSKSVAARRFHAEIEAIALPVFRARVAGVGGWSNGLDLNHE